MVLAAKLREHLRVPGMSVRTTIPFRDKEEMKRVLEKELNMEPLQSTAKLYQSLLERFRK
jgi:hypothetical protein